MNLVNFVKKMEKAIYFIKNDLGPVLGLGICFRLVLVLGLGGFIVRISVCDLNIKAIHFITNIAKFGKN